MSKDTRPAPVRLTKKSLYILEKIKAVSDGTMKKSEAIEEALSKEFSLFSYMYDEERK
jgi:hypothetical protein